MRAGTCFILPGKGHIPYRNSMLTSMLRDSLGGNCKTSMIATMSAENAQTDESISTCRFAQRVARVSNDAFVNEEASPLVSSFLFSTYPPFS